MAKSLHPQRKYLVKSSMICDFFNKENLLKKKYRELEPTEFYRLMFGVDYAKQHIAFFKNNETRKTYKFTDFEELLDLSLGRSDVYIAPCDFYANRRKKKFLNKLYAITIDIDNIGFVELRRLIAAKFNGLKPTLITHSGGGVHLVYVLSAPIDDECRPYFHPQIDAIFRAMREILRRPLRSRGKEYPVHYKVDNVSIVQQYRVVGSVTKLQYLVRGFRVGEFWTVEKLVEITGVKWEKYVPPSGDWQRKYDESNKDFKRRLYEWYRTRDEKAPENVVYIDKHKNKRQKANAKHGLWVHCDRRMIEVQAGSRHYALFALAVVAYKCGVALDLLIERLTYWQEYWSKRDGDPVKKDEVASALDGYSATYIRVTAAKLEEWFGWKFPRTKRNGRTQAQHLQKVANDKVERTKARIAAFLAENPDASRKKVAEALGMSRNTVAKYYM